MPVTAAHSAQGEDNPLIQAAEYVLGLLEPRAVREFEMEMAENPDLRDEVVFWTEHFAELEAGAEDVPPRPEVFRAIKKQIFGRTFGLFSQVASYVIGACAALALVWVVFGMGLLDPYLAPHHRAALTSPDGTMRFEVVYDARQGGLLLHHGGGGLPIGTVAEVWLLVGDTAPVSLGRMGPGVETRLPVAEELAPLVRFATLAISAEAEDSAASDVPTEPFLASGRLSLGP